MESALVLLSDLYSENKISVSDNKPSSCPAYTVLLTTSDYCLNQLNG